MQYRDQQLIKGILQDPSHGGFIISSPCFLHSGLERHSDFTVGINFLLISVKIVVAVMKYLRLVRGT